MLIAIEGVDKSGKETQTALLLERLRIENRNARKIEFPNYPSEAAVAIRMYLNGDFGINPDDVNPYAASVFFAVDRFASYKTDWGAFLAEGGIVIADRYTMSNMIHQGAKFTDLSERRKYIEWLVDLEFNKMGLPKPDIVIFLDLSMELRIKLLEQSKTVSRGIYNAAPPGKKPAIAAHHAAPDALDTLKAPAASDVSDASDTLETPDASDISDALETPDAHITFAAPTADIHERDLEYLRRSHICAGEVAKYLGWKRIEVGMRDTLRPALEIHEELYAAITPLLHTP